MFYPIQTPGVIKIAVSKSNRIKHLKTEMFGNIRLHPTCFCHPHDHLSHAINPRPSCGKKGSPVTSKSSPNHRRMRQKMLGWKRIAESLKRNSWKSSVQGANSSGKSTVVWFICGFVLVFVLHNFTAFLGGRPIIFVIC